MQSKLLAVLIVACGIIIAPSALAFNYGFLKNSVMSKMTKEDVKIGTQATVLALNSGSNGDWSNPQTGASGSIEILKTLDMGGYKDCRRTRLGVEAGGLSGSGIYTLCKNASGAWKFYSPSNK